MKIADFVDATKHCQLNRDEGICPLMTLDKKEKGCAIRELCEMFDSNCGIRMFYLQNVWGLIEEDVLSVRYNINDKGIILQKYEVMKISCDKAHSENERYSYCGNKCDAFTLYLCEKHLHHNLGRISAVYVQMSKVYPVVKWVFENLEEFNAK